VFRALLAAGLGDSVDSLIHQAWMKFDPAHAAQMMTTLGSSGMNVEEFKLQLSRGIVEPHLGTMLPLTATPTQAQMVLALTFAEEGTMPPHVREVLRKAAGGPASRAFPAALHVDT